MSLAAHPQRIVSLCPSITETLYDLGLGNRVVGRTRFCIHPAEQVKHAVRVGGTKEIKFDRLHALQPDLIICEKEENTPEMVLRLAERYPVYVGDVRDLPSAFELIAHLGLLTQAVPAATSLLKRIETEWSELTGLATSTSILYLIWQDPLMVVGNDTYIDAVLNHIGYHNVAKGFAGRYPTLSEADLGVLNPDEVWLSSEPFPFAEKHVAFYKALFPAAKVCLVDGEMFSWYGSRMRLASAYIREILGDR